MVQCDARTKLRTVSDDTVLLKIKYVGQGTSSGTNAVARLSANSAGLFSFFVSNTLDSNITGSAAYTGGQIDTQSAEVDTVKEFIDILNGLSADWVAWAEDGLPDDALSTVIAYRSDGESDNSNLWKDVGLAIYSDISKRKRLQAGIQNADRVNKLPDYLCSTRGDVEGIFIKLDKSANSDTATVMNFDILAVDDDAGTYQTVYIRPLNSTATNKIRYHDFDTSKLSLGEYGKRLVARMTVTAASTTAINSTMSVIGSVESHPNKGRFRSGNFDGKHNL